MSVTGYLADFSLAELFQLLEQGSKTGLLTICPLADRPGNNHRNHHIWFRQGQIVAAANSLDHQGLLRLIAQRGWMGDRAAGRLAQSCAINMPLGLCLKTQGVLSAEQLKLLFYTQVMRQVCALFMLKDGWFQFDPKAPIPVAEMTGLIAEATEATLSGLRALKDWTALEEKLPHPTSALISTIQAKPSLRLNPSEWQVWEFTNGTVTLEAIARQIQIPVDKVQQIAFRLIVAGLAEEMPMVAQSTSAVEQGIVEREDRQAEAAPISQSFLQNLVGFLRGKV